MLKMSKHIFKGVCGDQEQRNPHAVREKVPKNGTLKSKLCLRLSLKAIDEHSTCDGIKDSLFESENTGLCPEPHKGIIPLSLIVFVFICVCLRKTLPCCPQESVFRLYYFKVLSF